VGDGICDLFAQRIFVDVLELLRNGLASRRAPRGLFEILCGLLVFDSDFSLLFILLFSQGQSLSSRMVSEGALWCLVDFSFTEH
jgi:hypothetical protein